MADGVHYFAGGEIYVFVDHGVIMLKSIEPHGDPVELTDDDALELADTLRRLVAENGQGSNCSSAPPSP
jgi:hypothetical protein